MNRKSDLKSWAISVFLMMIAIAVWVPIIKTLTNNYRNNRQVSPPAMPTAIVQVSVTPFEHCVVKDTTGPAFRADAGTPIPSSPVPLNTPAPFVSNPTTASEQSTNPLPPVQVTPTAPVPTEALLPPFKLEAINVGEFRDDNFHIVLVGIGYEKVINQELLANTIQQIEPNFKNIRVDFAYIKDPLLVGLSHIAQSVSFDSLADREALFFRVRLAHPVDTVFLVLNTNEPIGNADGTAGGVNYDFVSGQDVRLAFIVTHEIGHQLGLDDGYNEYIPNDVPGTELFYADAMPASLSRALRELGTIPTDYYHERSRSEP
ncbi:MAG: hypothetical protein NTZ07_00510 [Candidatus Woesebacteria bacterium]|nr:hypothetical protein [Candidatus Woesebacteria bacterium]